MIRVLTTFFGVGLLRPAPGTWGSLAGILMFWGLHSLAGFWVTAAAVAAVTALGFWSVGIALKDRPGADPAEIVIDEVAGVGLAFLFPAIAFWFRDFQGTLPWPAALFPFLFFRLFDIWKPGPVGRADRRGDAAGVMWDDLSAGVLAGLASLVAAFLYHVPMILRAMNGE